MVEPLTLEMPVLLPEPGPQVTVGKFLSQHE